MQQIRERRSTDHQGPDTQQRGHEQMRMPRECNTYIKRHRRRCLRVLRLGHHILVYLWLGRGCAESLRVWRAGRDCAVRRLRHGRSSHGVSRHGRGRRAVGEPVPHNTPDNEEAAHAADDTADDGADVALLVFCGLVGRGQPSLADERDRRGRAQRFAREGEGESRGRRESGSRDRCRPGHRRVLNGRRHRPVPDDIRVIFLLLGLGSGHTEIIGFRDVEESPRRH